TAERNGEWIELDFPANREEAASPPAGLLDALGCTASYVGRSRFDYLVQVDSEKILRALKPNFPRLAELPVRGVIVTCRSDSPDFDFVSRFFAPATGVNEDPATGSSHCCLGPFWAGRLNKTEFVAYQASARGG